jgi:hypothetical protein
VTGVEATGQQGRSQRLALDLRAVASNVLAHRDEASPLAVQAAQMLDSISSYAAVNEDLPELFYPRARALADALVGQQQAEKSADVVAAELIDEQETSSLLAQFERLTEFRVAYPTGEQLSFMDACGLRLAEQVTAALGDAPRPYRLDVLREALLGLQLLHRTMGERAEAIALQLYSWTVVPAEQPGALLHDEAEVDEVAGDNRHLVHQLTVRLQGLADQYVEAMAQATALFPEPAGAELRHLSHRPDQRKAEHF